MKNIEILYFVYFFHFWLQEQAKIRMMKQRDCDKTESYWSDFWGKPTDYQNSGRLKKF